MMKMKVICVLVMFFFAFGACQFGDFGKSLQDGFDSIGKTIQEGYDEVVNQLEKVPFVQDVKDFYDFVKQTGKSYATTAERTLREGIFNARKALVEAENQLHAGYELALNAFADLTKEEFLSQLTGNRKSPQAEDKVKVRRLALKLNTTTKIPDSFDWRARGAVTPVKFQGKCGSCWAFAVTGALESHSFRKSGKLINLSEQNLIDCGEKAYGLDGCDGGYQEYGFEFISRQNGLAHGAKYPYVDKKNTCSYRKAFKAAELKGFSVIPPNDEETMKKVVATKGPLACSINALETLLLYKKGIYEDEECNQDEPNHSVLVVGYGTEDGQDYWTVKNSWDNVWGEEGYFRLPRGKNFCKIASECSYPVL
uniref:Peptidase C1A papain C-terminal domain-containing protein n=1 Tax=Glossina austeni TaxID=7395 RepID=A0A1A9VL08_GLOAU